MLPSAWKTHFLTVLLLTLAGVASAQDGVSSASASRTRYLGELGLLPTSKEVAVEEIVNYHRHQIGRPKAGEAVAMDVRWGNDTISADSDAVLQIGFSTALANDREQLRPLNLSLVIDKSGSMAQADKLVRVKSALLKLVSQLRDTDVLSIVVFDSNASVLMPAHKLADKEEVKDIIRGIEPGSATNLNAGLMLGYKEALKHYAKGSTNRVILLTDGIANQGVTEPDEIAKASQSFNDEGIDLSTIGVGLDLNKDLLRNLAKSGRGLFHFVADSEDIDKVFVRELQSLVSPVATEPNLEIEYGDGLVLKQIYGYDPKIGESSARIKLDNMNSGLTEVVLMRFKQSSKTILPMAVKVRLTYYDLDKKKQVVKTQRIVLASTEDARDMLADNEVAKNYTIALLAQSIHDMAADCEEHRYLAAEQKLAVSIGKANRRYPNSEDQDINRTRLVAEKYLAILKKRNAKDEGDGGQ